MCLSQTAEGLGGRERQAEEGSGRGDTRQRDAEGITAATYGPRERRTARKIDSMSRACAPPGTRSLIVGTENGRRDANCCSGGKQAHEKISTAHARTSTKLDEQIETNALR
jgi:hypothetical protein